MKKKFKSYMAWIITSSSCAGMSFIMTIDFISDQEYGWSLIAFVALLCNIGAIRLTLRVVFRDLGEAILWE